MIYKGLDDEEAGFLAFVVQRQADQKALVNQREKEEVSAFRVSVTDLLTNCSGHCVRILPLDS